MIDQLPWHFLQTWPSNGVLSRVLAVEFGLLIPIILWRVCVGVRPLIRIATTTAVIGISALMFTHPVDLSHNLPTEPNGDPYTFNQR